MTLGTVVARVQTEAEQGRPVPAIGWEYEAGFTPPLDNSPGCWMVRRTEDGFQVLFRSYLPERSRKGGPEYNIACFRPTDAGERAAKEMALKLREQSWEYRIKADGNR